MVNAEILEAYHVHTAEDRLIKEKNLVRHFYFDSYDIISMIQGIWHFDAFNKFNLKELIEDENSLIHGFVARGWLDQIRMLKPHQDEFIYKITSSESSFPAPNKYLKKEQIENDFLHQLGITAPDLLKLPENKFPKYVKILKVNAKTIFKSNYILDPIFWYDRYKSSLLENKLIVISHEPVNTLTLRDSQIFKMALNLLNAKRKERWLAFNNYQDALAIAQLQSLVDEFNGSSFAKPLPVFYASSMLKEVLEEIHSSNKSLLTYTDGERSIKVFRSSTYFVIEAIWNVADEEIESKAISDLNSLRNKLSQLAIDSDKGEQASIESDLANIFREDIEIEFFDKIWLRNKAYKELRKSILNFLQYYEKYDTQLELIVSSEREKIKKEFEKELKINSLLKQIIESLFSIKEETSTILEGYARPIDPFLIFGLTRFSFSDKAQRIIIEISAKLFTLYKHKDDATKHEYEDAISQLVSLLVSGVREKDNLHNLNAGLSILWILGNYNTIVAICKYFEENNTSDSIDFERKCFFSIYASSILSSSSPDLSEVRRIIDILGTFGKDNYKYDISKSFVLFQLWDHCTHGVSIPEKASGEQRTAMTKYGNCHDECLALIEKAMRYLEGMDINVRVYRRRKYYYLLNNHIYYCSRGCTKAPFKSKQTHKYYEQLRNAIRDNAVWQHRFYDSMGWYQFRHAFISFKKKRYEDSRYHLGLAREYNEKSFEGPNPKRSLLTYSTLRENIEELENDIRNVVETRHESA